MNRLFSTLQQFAITESAQHKSAKFSLKRRKLLARGCKAAAAPALRFSIGSDKADDDLTFERNGVTVLVDEMSIQYGRQ